MTIEPLLMEEMCAQNSYQAADLVLFHAVEYLMARARNGQATEPPHTTAEAVEFIVKAMLALPMPRWTGQTEHLECLIDTCRRVQGKPLFGSHNGFRVP